MLGFSIKFNQNTQNTHLFKIKNKKNQGFRH